MFVEDADAANSISLGSCSGTAFSFSVSGDGADYYAVRSNSIADPTFYYTPVASPAGNCSSVFPDVCGLSSPGQVISHNPGFYDTHAIWAHSCWYATGCSPSATNTSITCSAPLTPVNGTCAATHYNCSAGNLGVTAEYSNQWQWWCNGSNGGSNNLCAEMKPQCSDGSDNDSDGNTDYPSDPGCSSGSDNDEYNAPLTPPAPTGLTAGPDPGFENALVIRWNPVPGATYYAVRNDNNSNSWQYGLEPLLSSCINETITDAAILQQGGEYAGTYAGIDACGNTTATVLSLFTMASSYNNIWVHACNASGCSPLSQISVTLPPPSPTIVSATCDASGNTRVSWNAVPVPGGLDRHYAFRLDNQSNSWQFDLNNYRTNHDNCVFDTVDTAGVLAVPSGVGTDYCGNIRNTYWEGIINPSGTQKAWVHTKSRNYLSFGNLPPSEVTFTCSVGGPIPVNGVCGTANGGTFSTPPATDLCAAGTASPLPTGAGPWSWICLGSGGGANSPLCSATQSVGGGGGGPVVNTLKVCLDACDSGSNNFNGQSISFNSGEKRNLRACYNTSTACEAGSLGDVTNDPTTTFTDTNNPGNAVSLTGVRGEVLANTGVPSGITEERVDVSYGAISGFVRFSVPSVCSPDCGNAPNICQSQPFNDANGCGTNNCTGTKSCDYNWREVAP